MGRRIVMAVVVGAQFLLHPLARIPMPVGIPTPTMRGWMSPPLMAGLMAATEFDCMIAMWSPSPSGPKLPLLRPLRRSWRSARRMTKPTGRVFRPQEK